MWLGGALSGLRLLFSFLGEFFGEGVELRDAERAEPFEGHGPEDTGEDDDEEVADDARGVCVACAEGCERRGETRLDGENYAEAYRNLDELGIPARARFKLGVLTVNHVCRDKSESAAKERASVLETALVVMGIEGFVARDENHVNEESNRERYSRDGYPGHILIELRIILEDGTKKKDEGCGKDEGYADVKKSMYAKIHSGEAYEEDNYDADNSLFPLGLIGGNCAESACGILGMSRGEGIACCGYLCIANNLEGGVDHPRTGDAEEELRALVKNCAEEACYEDEIALPLIYAPEEEYCRGEEENLFAESCY